MAFDSILVTTGLESSARSAAKTEFIHIKNENSSLTCKDLKQYPLKIYGAVGFNMGSFPVICGGFDGSTTVGQCLRLKSGKWEPFANLTQG